MAGVFSCSVPLSHFQTYRDANADVHGPNVQGYIETILSQASVRHPVSVLKFDVGCVDAPKMCLYLLCLSLINTADNNCGRGHFQTVSGV